MNNETITTFYCMIFLNEKYFSKTHGVNYVRR